MITIGKGKLVKGKYGIRLIPKNIVLCQYAEVQRKDGPIDLIWKDVGHFGSLSSLIDSMIFKEFLESKAKSLSKLVSTQIQFMDNIKVDDIVTQLQQENQKLKTQLTRAQKELKEREKNELSN